ncbi:nuclear receptor coactivator 5 isoform X3 [Syngnathus typhle]|uniref:nuclear receptor coactivator 5 isoform X3 n=1 Tax=Syngnathus typhle TaxID=161592 RepID=UPI002A6A8E7C|nr:nuclear receptor coactivator 5 isoform X3 [Syngnathus typhle]
MSRRRSRSPSPVHFSRTCSSTDPREMERRIFVGNLPTSDMDKKDLEDLFSPYGKILGVSLLRGYGFVQFERVEEAEAAKLAQKGRIYKGYKIDVNMAVERRCAKPHSQPSPPRRPYGGFGDSKDPRPRSRSPAFPRDSRDRDARESRDRDSRDGRDGRDPRDPVRDSGREPRTGSHEYRYRGSENRDKDLRGGPRDPAHKEEYDRYYRGGNAPDDYYGRRKDDLYRDQYKDPWNGRREADVDDRGRPEERRRNELYRQYYEELQRRHETERPVDCSVIVVNKAQNREYAETVGRKVHDLGMVVDLIFLNTEVSLTQALEDVGRARTPFAIIITQQHQVHRSCTVNILFGTPQEHRNMPMQDAMMLIGHNYDTYKVETREKDREEIARKAAKMADDVLLREPDRESHPVSVLTSITLLAENRFIMPEELEGLIAYLTDKRTRLMRNPADPHAATVLPVTADGQPSAAGLPLVGAAAALPPALSARPVPQQSSHMVPHSGLVGPHSGLMAPQQSGHMAVQSSPMAAQSGHLATQPGGHMAPQPSHMVPQPSHMAPQSSHMAPQSSHMAPQSSHMASQPMSTPLSTQTNPNEELQAKILSLFKSTASGASSVQSQDYSSGRQGGAASQGYGASMGRSPSAGASAGGPRGANATGGINFDNPSVQKALDTLIQSGPALNHLVNTGSLALQQQPQQQQQQQQQMHQHQSQMHHHHHQQQQQQQQQLPPVRPAANMGQMTQMYPRHY